MTTYQQRLTNRAGPRFAWPSADAIHVICTVMGIGEPSAYRELGKVSAWGICE